MSEIKTVFLAEDGTTHPTRAEAADHNRRPLVRAAMMTLTGANEDMSEWLIENRDDILSCYDIGTVRRVTKSERNQLKKALDAIVEDGNPKFKFVIEHADAIVEGFKWPGQKRLKDEAKETAIKEGLYKVALADREDDESKAQAEQMADWLLSVQDQLKEAYDTGKPKPQVSPKAQAALAEYRAKQAAEKAAKEAAEESSES